MAKVKFEFDKNELNMLYYLIKNDLNNDLIHKDKEITELINNLSFAVKHEIVKFGVYDYRVKDMILSELRNIL